MEPDHCLEQRAADHYCHGSADQHCRCHEGQNNKVAIALSLLPLASCLGDAVSRHAIAPAFAEQRTAEERSACAGMRDNC